MFVVDNSRLTNVNKLLIEVSVAIHNIRTILVYMYVVCMFTRRS